MTLKQSSAVHIQALYSAEVILPGSSSKLQLLVINLASVPGGQLVNSPTAQSLECKQQLFKLPNLQFFRKIFELLSQFDKTEKLETDFLFPYSADRTIRRNQIWANLQNGILLEDNKTFILWSTPFNKVDKYKLERRDSGDRTNWILGKHDILNGYNSKIEVMKWSYLPWSNPMTEISINLGVDDEGMENFNMLREHLIEQLGEPTNNKWNEIELGTIEWKHNKVQISLTGFHHFFPKYNLNIGLIQDVNKEYFDKLFENSGLTEEELGK